MPYEVVLNVVPWQTDYLGSRYLLWRGVPPIMSLLPVADGDSSHLNDWATFNLAMTGCLPTHSHLRLIGQSLIVSEHIVESMNLALVVERFTDLGSQGGVGRHCSCGRPGDTVQMISGSSRPAALVGK